MNWKKLSPQKVHLDWLLIDYQYEQLPKNKMVQTNDLNRASSYETTNQSIQYSNSDELNKILYEYEKTQSKALLVKGKNIVMTILKIITSINYAMILIYSLVGIKFYPLTVIQKLFLKKMMMNGILKI